MSDPHPDSPGIAEQRQHIEQLEADLAAERAKTEASSALERENAFLKAGVDLDSPVGTLFARAYDGELDIDAVRAAADPVGALTSGTLAPTDTQLEQTKVQTTLAGEGHTPGNLVDATQTDPVDAGYTAFHDRLSRGATREAASAEMFDRVFTAAADGDQRVIYDPQRWREEQGYTP